MSSLNRVTLVGRLGADPEIKYTQGGLKIANMRIATSETWTDKGSGDKKEATQWHTVISFNEGLSKVIEQYVKKGDLILVEGQLEHRTWDKQDGSKGYATEVVLRFNARLLMLGGKGQGGSGRDYDRDEQSRGQTKSSANQSSGGFGSNPQPRSTLDDEIPF